MRDNILLKLFIVFLLAGLVQTSLWATDYFASKKSQDMGATSATVDLSKNKK
jgi:hypothetical protein